MLNFDKHSKTDESFKIEHNVNKEYTLKKSIRRIPGLKLWGFDPNKTFQKDNVIEINVQRKEVIDLSEKNNSVVEPEFQRSSTENKVLENPNMVYFQALNHKNAVKHALRYLRQNKYQR